MQQVQDGVGSVGALEAVGKRLDSAIAASRAATVEVVQASLHLLALQAREDHPEAVAVLLTWSDQGDFLSVFGLQGPTGSEIVWDDLDWDTEETVAWNLGGDCKSEWLGLVEPDQKCLDRANFRLPIQQTINHFAEEVTK